MSNVHEHLKYFNFSKFDERVVVKLLKIYVYDIFYFRKNILSVILHCKLKVQFLKFINLDYRKFFSFLNPLPWKFEALVLSLFLVFFFFVFSLCNLYFVVCSSSYSVNFIFQFKKLFLLFVILFYFLRTCSVFTHQLIE